mmetsp:Transcript_29164/g.66901  ORF Transcript_29164/g.66901 Transcript_29164/m.66901 type:complete len:83 (-) Transcript_29164:2095-2343(-)
MGSIIHSTMKYCVFSNCLSVISKTTQKICKLIFGVKSIGILIYCSHRHTQKDSYRDWMIKPWVDIEEGMSAATLQGLVSGCW